MHKEITAPNIIHSEKGTGFHDFFKEQCKKIEHSQLRVKVVTSPDKITEDFRKNYDYINWSTSNNNLKMLS